MTGYRVNFTRYNFTQAERRSCISRPLIIVRLPQVTRKWKKYVSGKKENWKRTEVLSYEGIAGGSTSLPLK